MSRRVITLMLWAVIGGLLLTAFLGNWQEVWGACRQASMAPKFADLRTITGALASADQGFDPVLHNPMDPWGRLFNYPPIWMRAFAALGIDNNNVVFVGIVLALLYLITVSWLVLSATTRGEAVVVGLAAVSNSALFAVERGNTDLLIFALLVVGLRPRPAWQAAIALPVAALLKVYPVMALIAGCCRRRRDGLIWWSLLGIGCAALLLSQWADLARIAQATPVDHTWSYGLLSLRALLQTNGVAPIAAMAYLVGTIGLGAVLCLATGLLTTDLPSGGVTGTGRTEPTWVDRMFVGCGMVYVGTFLLGSNYDYRLVMLLPTLPWWWRAFLRQRQRQRLRSLLPVLLALFVMNVDALGSHGIWAGHVAKVLMLFFLLHHVPRVMRAWLHNEPARVLVAA